MVMVSGVRPYVSNSSFAFANFLPFAQACSEHVPGIARKYQKCFKLFVFLTFQRVRISIVIRYAKCSEYN